MAEQFYLLRNKYIFTVGERRVHLINKMKENGKLVQHIQYMAPVTVSFSDRLNFEKVASPTN